MHRLDFTPPDSPSAHEEISQNTLSWFPCIPLEHNYCCAVPKSLLKVSFWQLHVYQSQRHRSGNLAPRFSLAVILLHWSGVCVRRWDGWHAGWDVASQGRRGGSELVSETLITARAGCLWDLDMQEAWHLLNEASREYTPRIYKYRAGRAEAETVRWPHWLTEPTAGDSEGQGSLGRKELDTTAAKPAA